MSDCIKATKKDFNPDIYVLHVGTNELTLSNTTEQIAKLISDIDNSLNTDNKTAIVSIIVHRGNENKEKSEKAIQIINNACVQSNILVMNQTNIDSK